MSPEWFEQGTVEALDCKGCACRFRDNRIGVEQQLEGEKMCEHYRHSIFFSLISSTLVPLIKRTIRSVFQYTPLIFVMDSSLIGTRFSFEPRKSGTNPYMSCSDVRMTRANIEHVSAGSFSRQSHEIDPVLDLGDTHIICRVRNESYHLLRRDRRRILDLKTNRQTRFMSIDVTDVNQLSTLSSSLRCARQDSNSRTVSLPSGLSKNVS